MTREEIDQQVLQQIANGATTRRTIQEGSWRWIPGLSDDARRVAVGRSLRRLLEKGEVTRTMDSREYTYALAPSDALRPADFHEGPSPAESAPEPVPISVPMPVENKDEVSLGTRNSSVRTRNPPGPAERYRFVQAHLAKMNPSELAADIVARFGVHMSTAWADIRDVRRTWQEQDKELAPALRADMMERLFLVYSRALDAEDLKASVSALKQICKITGLEETTVRTILGADEGVGHLLEALALTPAQRAARIAELEAKAHVEPAGPSQDLLMAIAQRVATELKGIEEEAPYTEDGQPTLSAMLRQAGVLE